MLDTENQIPSFDGLFHKKASPRSVDLRYSGLEIDIGLDSVGNLVVYIESGNFRGVRL